MKITRRQLRRIIKEELSRALLAEGILDRSSGMSGISDEEVRSEALREYILTAENDLRGTRGGETLWREKLDKHDARDALVQELKDEGKLEAFQAEYSGSGMTKARAEIKKIVESELERVAAAFDEDNQNGELESWVMVRALFKPVE